MTPTNATPAAAPAASAISPAIAAWEAATVQNLNPLLTPGAADALWKAIVAHRSTGNVEAFEKAARAIASTADQQVRATTERAITALIALHPAAPAAKE